jgi:hypothetical protein
MTVAKPSRKTKIWIRLSDVNMLGIIKQDEAEKKIARGAILPGRTTLELMALPYLAGKSLPRRGTKDVLGFFPSCPFVPFVVKKKSPVKNGRAELTKRNV